MQRILYFELATALKDRPKIFQFITLVILAFAIAVILFKSFGLFFDKSKDNQTPQQNNPNSYAQVWSVQSAYYRN